MPVTSLGKRQSELPQSIVYLVSIIFFPSIRATDESAKTKRVDVVFRYIMLPKNDFTSILKQVSRHISGANFNGQFPSSTKIL